jgi:hypothetical protein
LGFLVWRFAVARTTGSKAGQPAKGGQAAKNGQAAKTAKTAKTDKRLSAKERVAAARAADRRRRRREIAAWSAGGVVAVGVAATVVALGISGSGGNGGSGRAGTSATAQPPWAAPSDTVTRAENVGLSVAPMEGAVVHFHTHLDVLVNGKPVDVASQIGIAPNQSNLAEMHTHDTTGILHIESPSKDKKYTLGQLFTEWNVRLDATELGGLKAGGGNTLTAYVDGKPQPGNPADIQLTPHREIALVYGPANAHPKVPSSYKFAPGL